MSRYERTEDYDVVDAVGGEIVASRRLLDAYGSIGSAQLAEMLNRAYRAGIEDAARVTDEEWKRHGGSAAEAKRMVAIIRALAPPKLEPAACCFSAGFHGRICPRHGEPPQSAGGRDEGAP